jgi:hypothetical protein
MRVFALLGALAVSGCVGESYYYYGFPAVSSPSASGNFSGVAASDTDVYSDGSGNGYVLAYAKGYDAWDLGVTGALPGDRAFVAIAGILPTTSLGVTPTSGSATMSGEYNVIWIDAHAYDPESWPERNRNGAIDIQFLFDPSSSSFYGLSDDGRLELYGSLDGVDNLHGMYVEYDGLAGGGAIYVDSDEAVGIFLGEGTNDFYVGGVQVEE